MIIYVGGISGVGKTTIIEQVINIARKQGIKIETTKGLKILCKLVGVKTIKELRFVPEKIKAKFRSEMYCQIYESDKTNIATIKIADGHFCFFDIKEKKYAPRVIQRGDKNQTLFMIVITATPKNILKRRKQDNKLRSDRQLNFNSIKKEQKLELKIASNQAKSIGKPIEILKNREGKLDETINAFIHLIKKYG